MIKIPPGLHNILEPLTDIRPDPANPNLHDERSIAEIQGSIEAFGFDTPIVADESGLIIAGHGRYAAAIRLKMEMVPVVRTPLGAVDRVRRMIGDNRIARHSRQDDAAVAALMREICGLDYSLAVGTGYSEAEVMAMISAPDVEEILADADATSSGVDTGGYLAFAGFKIPLDHDEQAGLVALLKSYSDLAGTTFGFAADILRKIGG